MKFSLAVGVICCIGHAISKTITTKLDSYVLATVYSGNKAEIERLVKVDESLSTEEYHTIVVHGFTENVMDETVRLASETDVEVLDMKISTVRTPRANMPEYLALALDLKAQMKSLLKEKEEQDNSYARLETRLNSVDSYVKNAWERNKAGVAAGGGSKAIPLADIASLLDYQSKEQLTVTVTMQGIREKQAVLINKIDVLNKKIASISNEENYPVDEGEDHLPLYRLDKVLSFRIKLVSSKKTEFSVSYMTTTASWSPEYDIRIESKAAAPSSGDAKAVAGVTANGRGHSYSLEIDYFANVVQNTGESWTDTPLVLSSANPKFISKPNLKLKPDASSNDDAGWWDDDDDYWTFNEGNFVEQVSGLSSEPALLKKFSGSKAMKRAKPKAVLKTNQIRTESVATGDIGASHKFKVVYPVSVESTNLMLRALKPGTEHVRQKHLILVDKLVLDTHLYTFAVPSQKPEGFMVSLSKYELSNSQETKPSPLLASPSARLFIQGDNIGVMRMPPVQPGEMMKLNLGVDKNIHIDTVKVVPKLTKEEEDKSTWFFKDKRKFRVRTEERLTTIRSSYPTTITTSAGGGVEASRDVLVIVAESLPRSMEVDEVSVELLSSSLRDAVTLDGSSSVSSPTNADAGGSSSSGGLKGKALVVPTPDVISPASAGNDAFIEGIVARETKPNSSSGGTAPYTVYYCKLSGNLYWAVWLKAGESVTIPFKYKITWPEDHVLEMSS